MERAFLVDVCLRTRVVVDVPDDWDEHTDVVDKISELACKKLTEQVMSSGNPICLDNVTEIEEDYECPYGELEED